MKFKGLLHIISAAALSLFVLASSGGDMYCCSAETAAAASLDASSNNSSFSVPLKKLKLSPKSEYRIVPISDDGEITYQFKSSNNKIVKVSSKGLVRAVKTGKASVTVTASDGSNVKVSVTVVDDGSVILPQNVYFSEEQCNIITGEIYHPTALIAPRGASYSVSYYSDDESVAAVDASGNITGISPGICRVTILTDNGISDSITVVVSDEPAMPLFVEYEQDSIILAPGEKVKPVLNANPSDNIKFYSENRSVAMVSTKGTILGVSEGYTEVTASNGYFSDSVMVYVTSDPNETNIPEQTDDYIYDAYGNILPSGLEFEHYSDSVEVGKTISPVLRVYPKGALQNFTFHSSDTSVAVVSKSGKVKGVGEGECEIYVTSENGLTASFTLSVYSKRFSGIDVSKWNGDIDWQTVSMNPDVDFVMIRASYGVSTADIRLVQNVEGCEAYNIPYGFYHYMYATTVEEAITEAEFFLSTVRPYNPTYPLVLDIEEPCYKEMSKEEVTDIVCAFMEKIEDAGYYAMIYSYASFFGDSLIYDRVKIYDNWVACWGDMDRLSENFSYPYGMWQYSETGRIDGIPEDVDLNYCYRDYPYLINKYGLTGYNNYEVHPEDDEDGDSEITDDNYLEIEIS